MYDCVEVKAPLPCEITGWNPDWQTKSFGDPRFDYYLVSEAGEIFLKTWPNREDDGRAIPPAEEPVLTKIDFHGDLNFYDIAPDKTWWEFIARFTEGKLTKIWQVEDEE